jgi:hypothetical protein
VVGKLLKGRKGVFLVGIEFKFLFLFGIFEGPNPGGDGGSEGLGGEGGEDVGFREREFSFELAKVLERVVPLVVGAVNGRVG